MKSAPLLPLSPPLGPVGRPGRRRLGRSLRAALVVSLVAGTGYAAAVAAIWWGQERLLFRPEVLAHEARLARDADVRESRVDVPGARLSMLELRLPAPRGVVFFLHGNSGNLASWFVNTEVYRRANLDLVMLDFRGYGKSTGHIESEAQLHEDVRAAWQQVAPRYHGKRVVVYGRSLGTGLAATLAAAVQPDLTLLVSPYESMVALAREHYPWVPAAVLRYPLRTDEQIGRIHQPVLLVHGERDALIPAAHSQALLARARAARLLLVPGAGHGDVHEFAPYRQALEAALTALK